jgi:hypothetical protein
VVASQIGWFHSLVYSEIGRRIVAGEKPAAIAEALFELLDIVEGTLGERALGYATREAGGARHQPAGGPG